VVSALALLDVGPTEFLLIAGLFLLLFGADKVPDLARGIGKASAQFRGAAKEFQSELDKERGVVEQEFRPGDAVPPDQKAQLEAVEADTLRQLRQAARSLGIEPGDMDEAQLRAAIAAKVQR
jgi:sec-independent protein translocase protein TatA